MNAHPDRIIREPELCRILAVSPTTINRQEAAGLLPRRFKISRQAVGFRLTQIMAVIDARARGAGDQEIKSLVQSFNQ